MRCAPSSWHSQLLQSLPPPVVGYEYNANGKATRSILAPGVTGFNFATTNTYDSLDRVKDTTDARNGIAQLWYNGRSDLIQVTDPRNLVTQYPRNGLSDPTSLVSPDTGTATHSFDAAGNLATRTDSRGVLGTYTYDAANRLTGITYSQSGQPSLSYSWTYDQTDIGYSHGIGRLTSTVHPSGSTQHAYDAQGRLLTDTQRVNAAAGANATQVSLAVTYGRRRWQCRQRCIPFRPQADDHIRRRFAQRHRAGARHDSDGGHAHQSDSVRSVWWSPQLLPPNRRILPQAQGLLHYVMPVRARHAGQKRQHGSIPRLYSSMHERCRLQLLESDK